MAKSNSISNVLWLPTDLLLDRFHPENPREHSWDEGADLEAIADSLVNFGWLTFPSLQVDNEGDFGYILSGHGRIMSADNLRQQDNEWWEKEWQRWLKVGDRQDIADKHKQRFCPEYWSQCPVVVATLDEKSQRSALLRLNNTARDGVDNNAKIAAILAKLPKRETKLAGWQESTKNVFIQAYLTKRESFPAIPNNDGDDAEVQGKQVFERPDATDYTNGWSGQEEAKDGQVSLFSMDEVGDTDWANDAEIAIANTDDINEVSAENQTSNYNPDFATQTRFLVYLGKEELSEFKDLVGKLADRFVIKKTGNTHEWRSRTLLTAIRTLDGMIGEDTDDKR